MSLILSEASRRVSALLALVLAVLFAGGVHAKSIKKQNLVEIMSHADSIVIGTVAGKTDGFHQGLPYTEITLDVGQSVKGDHGSRYTFRQFGLIEPKSMGDGRVNLMVTPAGWPTYAVGEQVLLFLHKPASATGFQTTAGLTQGKFTMRGSQIANGVNNESLFAGVQINQTLGPTQQDLVNQPGGAYAAEDFLAFVRTAVEENWIENGVMTHEN
jgi:hypothetical protein